MQSCYIQVKWTFVMRYRVLVASLSDLAGWLITLLFFITCVANTVDCADKCVDTVLNRVY